MTASPYLILPGLGNSGPAHWQSLWQAELGCERLELPDWDAPRLSRWLYLAIEAIEQRPGVVLIAHSLGCILVAHVAAARPDLDIGGALLVAPADVDSRRHTPDRLADFAPLPRVALPFPAVLVASRNDPHMDFAVAENLAADWGARLIDAGEVGHINVASGHGDWPEGRGLLAAVTGGGTHRRAPVEGHPAP